MLMLPQVVTIKWNKNPKQRQYYIDKGYIFTKVYDEFEVNVLDLKLSSQFKVWVECDYCYKKVQKYYGSYTKQKEKDIIKKDCCFECQPMKYKESNLVTYGVENSFQREDVKEKFKESVRLKYDVDNISQSDAIKQKKKETSRKNFGVDFPQQSQEIKTKTKKIFLERYGVDNPTKNPEIRAKQIKTLNQNNNSICSRQQRYIFDCLGGKLNFPASIYTLDIAFEDCNIYLEYDGSGHDLCVKLGNTSQEAFDEKEKTRSKKLNHLGWREIRIISRKDYLPSKTVLNDMLTFSKTHFSKEYNWIIFDIDKGIISSELGIFPFYFGQLSKINNVISKNKEEIK